MRKARSPIVRRRVHIPFDPAKARGWHLDSKDVEDFLNAISFTFPPGEKFFIQSVQNYADRLTDPDLKDQVKRFIYQEAMHTKEHARCNEALVETYPSGPQIEKYTAACFRLTRLLTPKISQLAATCALEHFTAILADSLLRNQERFVASSDPAFASLWLWHAVEEAEHKAVCFDVYETVAGRGLFGYLQRVVAMFLTSLCFLVTLAVAWRLLKKAEKAPDAAAAAPAAKKPGLRQLLGAMIDTDLYFDYYRYSFHPWDHDNTENIEEWKRRYKDFGAGPDAVAAEIAANATASGDRGFLKASSV